MRNNPHLKAQWSRILSKQDEMRRKAQEHTMFTVGRRKPAFGAFATLAVRDPALVDEAKRVLIESSYLPAKARLMHMAGVRLSSPLWVVKGMEPSEVLPDVFLFPSVGWKAYADKYPSKEALRRMRLADKRAHRCR